MYAITIAGWYRWEGLGRGGSRIYQRGVLSLTVCTQSAHEFFSHANLLVDHAHFSLDCVFEVFQDFKSTKYSLRNVQVGELKTEALVLQLAKGMGGSRKPRFHTTIQAKY